MDDFLQVDSLIVSFGDRTIISNAYLRCNIGDVIGIFGCNGSGKTTLLKSIYGTIQAESKSVCIDGVIQTSNAFVSRNISYLPQNSHLPNNSKIRTIIDFCISKDYSHLVMSDSLVLASLDKKPHQLSCGELRYIETLLLLFGKARYIFLDEPFNGVSPILTQKMIDYLCQARSQKGIVIVSHNIQTILPVINRAIILQGGSLRELNSFNSEHILSHLSE